MRLLYTLGQWHGFAKLRMHTDHTLKILDDLTVQLGDSMMAFIEKMCAKIATKELPREYQARKRREARQKKGVAKSKAAPVVPEPSASTQAMEVDQGSKSVGEH